MKNLLFISFICLLMSCENYDESFLEKKRQNRTQDLQNTPVAASPDFSIKKGSRLFNNCNYSLPCGPCRGICIKIWGIQAHDETVVEPDLMVGDIALVNADTQLELDFGNQSLIDLDTGGDSTKIDTSFHIDANLSQELGHTQILVKEGVYGIDGSVIKLDCEIQ